VTLIARWRGFRGYIWAPAVIPVTILPRDASDAGEAVGGRPEPSADLLRQLDDDPHRAADVAEAITVFVALHLANELRAEGSQASDDGDDGVDCDDR
jgi:hypothetical protein